MLDRLRDLKGRNPNITALNQSYSDNTILEGKEFTMQEEGIEQKFFQKIKTAKAYIHKIRNNTQKIEVLRQMFYRATKGVQEKEATSQLEELTKENKFSHQKIKQILEQIKQEVDDCENNEDLKNQPETRMKKNFYNTTTNQVMEMLKAESAAEDSFKTSVKSKLTRQVKIINKDLTDEQVQQYVNQPEKAQMMLQQKIYGQASHNLKNAVSDIQDKFRDMQKLQQCVSECLQLFKELSAMVFLQGQMIDNIEANCNTAKDYVEKADKQLIKAKEHHQCSKKCMCILIVVGIIVLLVVLIPIIVTFTKK